MSLEKFPLCPISRAAIVVGSKWTPQILGQLLEHGTRRYQDLVEALPGIAPNTLSHRLKLLEGAGIVERSFYEQNPPRAEYVITDKGRTLNGVIGAMREWGERFGSA